MNSKTSNVALIIALSYEILFKLWGMLLPSFTKLPLISGFTRVLSFAVGIIIIIFMYYFYKDERANKKITTSMKLLIIFFIIQCILRLTTVRHLIGYSGVFIAAEVAGVGAAFYCHNNLHQDCAVIKKSTQTICDTCCSHFRDRYCKKSL